MSDQATNPANGGANQPAYAEASAGLPAVASAQAGGPIDQLLPLDSPERTVRIRELLGEKPKIRRHIFSAIKENDWQKFFAHLQAKRHLHEGRFSIESRSDEASCKLWDRRIVRIEGYRVAGKPSHEQPIELWRSRVPVSHKVATVELLQEVLQADDSPDDFELAAEELPVVLSANWNGRVYEPLLHLFRAPGQDDEMRFRRLDAQSFEIKGSRGISWFVPSVFGPLVELYNKLIVRVEGYAVAGQPLTEPAHHMDAIHKITAVALLFRPKPIKLETEEESSLSRTEARDAA